MKPFHGHESLGTVAAIIHRLCCSISQILYCGAFNHVQHVTGANTGHEARSVVHALSLTCVTPATSKGVGKSHNVGAEHDARPELASDKPCQRPTNEESRHDVASCCVHSRNPKDEGGSKHEKEGIRCRTQKACQCRRTKCFVLKSGNAKGRSDQVWLRNHAGKARLCMHVSSKTHSYSIAARTCRMPGPSVPEQQRFPLL